MTFIKSFLRVTLQTIVVSSLFIFGAAGQATTVPTEADVSAPPALASLRTEILARIASGELPSVSIGVARGSEVLWLEAMGWADTSSKRAASPGSVYPVGSMSKSITATAVFALAATGGLDLDGPAIPLLARPLRSPDGGRVGSELLVTHLLHSTGGVPHGSAPFRLDATPPGPLPLEEAAFLAFAPGSHFEYSNNSFGALQQIVQNSLRTTYHAALQRLVFEPLGMVSSGADAASFPIDGRALRNGGPPEAVETRLVPAGGLGIQSSARDLIRFGMFHAGSFVTGQGPFNAEWRGRMHGAQTDAPFSNGWWRPWRAGLWVSNGNVAGANAHLTVAPSEQLAIVVLTNTSTNAADEFAGQILGLLAPDVRERGATFRADYAGKFRTPFDGNPQWSGTWSGATVVASSPVSFVLDVGQDSILVSVDGGDPVPLQYPTLNVFDELRGHFVSTVAALQDEPLLFSLRMFRDGNRITGYVSASLQRAVGGEDVPFFVSVESTGGEVHRFREH
jgi:D-alanyl-D-alanine-carboxypeptidase/D-alanyl-D-alanine-endopeptidase